jgi:hypothetical protein
MIAAMTRIAFIIVVLLTFVSLMLWLWASLAAFFALCGLHFIAQFLTVLFRAAIGFGLLAVALGLVALAAIL